MQSASNTKESVEKTLDYYVKLLANHPGTFDDEDKTLEYIKTLDEFLHGTGIS